MKNRFLGLLPLSSSASVPVAVAAAPVAVLLAALLGVIIVDGPDSISSLAPFALLGASAVCVIIAACCKTLCRRGLAVGLRRSASQILPAVPMLLCIAALATTWMASGVVPTLIYYGLELLNPQWFLVTTCVVCAVISVLTGSSWSTIATIGVAFMGIGTAMGYGAGWVAGAIISGAYFGDKVSPLSDTTVVASSTCGVDLFAHIRYLMLTSVPAMSVGLLVFGLRGFYGEFTDSVGEIAYLDGLASHFDISAWTLVIPALTAILIALRVPTMITLGAGALAGAAGALVLQPDVAGGLAGIAAKVWSGLQMSTGVDALDALVGTGGILGMLPTVELVLSALVFGWVMIGTGMLGTISAAITRRMKRRGSVVSAVVVSGLAANSCTADQYLSLIITGNMYRGVFRRVRLEPRLLSRTIEDSVSVTSVLIPWNSCGVTQSAVLGVGTLTYLPYCIFNYLSPLMSLLMVWTGFKIHRAVRAATA